MSEELQNPNPEPSRPDLREGMCPPNLEEPETLLVDAI